MPASPALYLAASALGAALFVAAAIWRVRRAAQAVPQAQPQAQTARRFAGAYAVVALVWLAYALLAGLGPFVVNGQIRPEVLLYQDRLVSVALFIGAVAWAGGLAVQWVLRLLRLLRQEAERLPSA